MSHDWPHGVLVSRSPLGTRADAEAAIAAARRAFDEGPWPRMAGRERAVARVALTDEVEPDCGLLPHRDGNHRPREGADEAVASLADDFRTRTTRPKADLLRVFLDEPPGTLPAGRLLVGRDHDDDLAGRSAP